MIKRSIPWTSQPPPGVGPNPKWIARGMRALFDCRQARELISGDFATNRTSLLVPGPGGMAADFSGTTNQQYAHRDAYALTGATTIAPYMDVDALSSFGAIITKHAGNGTTNGGYELRCGYTSASSRIAFSRGNPAGFRQYAPSSDTFTVPIFRTTIIVSSPSGVITDTFSGMVNGEPVTMALAAGAGTGNTTDNGEAVWIGRRSDGLTQLNGRIYYIPLFNVELSDAHKKELTANPWDVYAPLQRNIYVSVAASSPTIVTLDPATLTFNAQDTQNTVAATLSTAMADLVAQPVQPLLASTLTASALNFTAQDTQNSTTNNLTAAAFDFVGQDTQNTLGLLLENAIFDFVTRSITAGDPLAPTTGRATNMMLMGVGN